MAQQTPPQPQQPGQSDGKTAIIVAIITLIGVIITTIGVIIAAIITHSPASNSIATNATTATASAVAALQCQFGTLQSQTTIPTKVEDVPDGSALVVTLPTAGDAQVVVLFTSQSDLDKYACRHDLALIPVTHTGPEILVLHEEGRSSVDLILYRRSPTIKIKVVPNTQTASEISNFKQNYPNAQVFEDINHQQSTPDQNTIP